MTRRLPRLALALLAASLAAGCGGAAEGPPELVVDRTACARCSMLISAPEVAAAYRVAGRPALAFDDTACLLAALAEESSRDGLAVWFQDAEGSGWIEASAATLVRTDPSLTPMGGGVLAFRDPRAAEATARERDGRVLAFSELGRAAADREARR